MLDLIVVGAGPAGITAAIYAARKRIKTLVLSENIGGRTLWSLEVENYTGFQYLTGQELGKKFEKHLKSFSDIVVRENEKVLCIKKYQQNFKVSTKAESFSSRAVILATGRRPRLLGIPGEEKFKNKGVTYCATCDGPLFADQDVAIIGGGNSALESALQMTKIANQVYLININNQLSGDPVLVEKIKNADNAKIINNASSREIIGDVFVEALMVEANGQKRKIPVQGIFVEVGSLPIKDPLCDLKENENKEVVVNNKCETSIPGLFAAGDVTNVPYKQIVVAAGQGCIAALSVFSYLSKN